MFVNWETSNRYAIKNSVGQQVYFAAEESDTCHRQCCGPARGFVMHITDNLGQVSRQYIAKTLTRKRVQLSSQPALSKFLLC